MSLTDPYNAYQENGFRNRKEYLENISQEYDCPIGTVLTLASLLGKEEDFDGLIVAMQDWQSGMYNEN